MPDILKRIITKNQHQLRELHILVYVKRLKIKDFDNFNYKPKKLEILDIKKLENISERALSSIFVSSHASLKSVKLPYKS